MVLAAGNPDISTDLWHAALDALERKFSKPIFEMWIKPLRLVSFTGNELLLAVHNNFARDWVENRLRAQIAEILSDVLGSEVKIAFTVANESALSVPSPGGGSRGPAGARCSGGGRVSCG